MSRVLAFSDLHLGAGAAYSDDRLADQEAVLDQIAAIAKERDVSLVAIAGDIFDKPRPAPPAIHVFRRFARSLADAGIPAVAIHGNLSHDLAHSEEASPLELFDTPMLRVFRKPGLALIGGVAVAALPSVPVHRLVAAADGGDRAAIFGEAARLLLEVARGLHKDIQHEPDLARVPSLLVTHFAITGNQLPAGLPTDTLHEPVLPLDELHEIGFDAVVAGHIHVPGVLADGGRPVISLGSPMTLNFGEEHVAHGAWLLDSEADGEFVPLESRRFVTVDVDLTQDSPNGRAESQPAERGHARLHADGELGGQGPGMRARIPGPEDSRAEDSRNASGENAESSQDPIGLSPASPALDETDLIAAAIAERLPLTDAVIRIRYRATEEQDRAVNKASLRKLCLDAGAARVYQIQPEIIRQSRARAEGVDETLEPLAAVAAWADVAGLDQDQTTALRDLAAELLGEQVRA